MTARTWSTAPYTIHVNGDPSSRADDARAAGALVLTWSLAGVRDRRQLDESAAMTFEFPFPSATLDGLEDMLSDLEWLDVEHGVLIVIDASEARESIVEDVAGIMPAIVDRWRAGSEDFEAWLVGVGNIASVATALEKSNTDLDDFGRGDTVREDIARVPVIIHD
jgi:hypothetical protein